MPILIAKRNEKVRLIGPESWESEGRWAVGWILDDEKEAVFEAPILETLKRGGWLHVEERIEFPEPENYVMWSAPPGACLLYTSPSPRDRTRSRMPSSA